MNRNIYISIVGMCLMLALRLPAQDPQLSQYYSVPVLMSPSFAGSTEGSRATVTFRDQWPTIPGTYITAIITADHYHYATNSGYGFFIMKDYQGDAKFNYTYVGLAYSYFVQLTSKLLFVPAISPNFYQRSINFDQINFTDQLVDGEFVNPTLEDIDRDYPWHFDLNASMLVYSDKFWMGMGLDHLMKFSSKFSEDPSYIPLKFSVYAGMKIKFTTARSRSTNSRNSITPIVSYKLQDQVGQFDIGAYFQRNKLQFGAWYRANPLGSMGYSQDALVLMAGFTKDWFKVGYSYDFTISSLIANTGGAHELTLVFTPVIFDNNGKASKRKRSMACPQIH